MDIFELQKPITVSELVTTINRTLKLLPEIYVEGEIGDFTNHRTGHWYFSLKEGEKYRINCTMWSSLNKQASFIPEVGQVVRIRGELDYYGPYGKLSLNARSIERSGEGELLAKFLALRKKLSEEGLFRKDIKRPIPLAPRTIGIIAGANTAALKDAVTRLEIQAPYASIVIYPALVQGLQAVASIKRAMQLAEMEHEADVLLLIRGGGSIEDLWCFNDESLARAIRACQIPIVTGIGHSTDETIADYVADLWCQTPTQAANAAGTDKQTLLSEIDTRIALITKYLEKVINEGQNYVGNASFVFGSAENLLSDREAKLQNAYAMLGIYSSGLVQTLQENIRREALTLQHSIDLENKESGVEENLRNLKFLVNQEVKNLELSVSYARPSSKLSLHVQEEKVNSAKEALNFAYGQFLSTQSAGLQNAALSLQASGNLQIKSFEQLAQFQKISSEDLIRPFQNLMEARVHTFSLCKPKLENTKIRQMAALLSSSGELSITRKANELLNLESKLSRVSSKKILEKGYAQVSNERGFVVSIKDVGVGEDVTVRLSDGSFVAQVKEVSPSEAKE